MMEDSHEKIHIELGDIQKTLLLPLWGRAVESGKKHPLLVDDMAVKILQRIDFDTGTFSGELSVISQLGWVTRSILLEEIIKQFVQKHPRATIVDIGCGLDTLFERVDNGTIRWYDLDLPDTMELRKKFFEEGARRTFIVSSFLEADWLKQLVVQDQVLFISAGVLYYFEEGQIRTFLRRLANLFPGSEMAFDAASPFGVRMANKMVLKKGGMEEGSFLRWGIRDSKELESWDPRIKILSDTPFFKKIRPRTAWKTRMQLSFSDFTRIQYLVHLRFEETKDN